ncbi:MULTISPECIES: hypothetical protein [Halomonas]|uniref:hypothetical protein n=1 Tax=Halomonas TaxID=2745 RepID=UPI000A28B5CD|nr:MULTISPECIES: hypothetical protein [Halomonas]
MTKNKEKEEWFVDFTSDFIIDEYYYKNVSVHHLKLVIACRVKHRELSDKIFEAVCSKLALNVEAA